MRHRSAVVGTVLLTVTAACNLGAASAPPKGRIVFQSDREGIDNYEIYAVKADGPNLAQLTGAPENDAGPDWSP